MPEPILTKKPAPVAAYWAVPRLWEGQTCVILGCGPSLKPFAKDISELTVPVLAINDSWQMVVNRPGSCNVAYFCDFDWYHGQVGSGSRGELLTKAFQENYIVTLENLEIPGVCHLRDTGSRGLESASSGLRTGNNSGYQAINLACHLGVKKIILLGYDMRVHPETRMLHWNHRPEDTSDVVFDQILEQRMLPMFAHLVAPLADLGIEVINATPGSRLTVWPQREWTDVLPEIRSRYPTYTGQ